MVQIYERPERKSQAQQWGEAVGQGLQQFTKNYGERRDKSLVRELQQAKEKHEMQKLFYQDQMNRNRDKEKSGTKFAYDIMTNAEKMRQEMNKANEFYISQGKNAPFPNASSMTNKELMKITGEAQGLSPEVIDFAEQFVDEVDQKFGLPTSPNQSPDRPTGGTRAPETDDDLDEPQTDDDLDEPDLWKQAELESFVFPNLSRVTTARAKAKSAEEISDKKYNREQTQKAIDQVNVLKEKLPKIEMSAQLARDAIESGNTSYFSLDKLADKTGIDLFRTQKGSQLITASKEYLLNNMSRVSSKAQNIWFEQRLNSMFPKIGQSNEANLTALEMLEGENLMDRAYISNFNRLYEKEIEEGEVKENIRSRALKDSEQTDNLIMRRTSYRLKQLQEKEWGTEKLEKKVGKNVVNGTPLTFRMARLYINKYGLEKGMEMAKKNGYKISPPSEVNLFEIPYQEFAETL